MRKFEYTQPGLELDARKNRGSERPARDRPWRFDVVEQVRAVEALRELSPTERISPRPPFEMIHRGEEIGLGVIAC